MSRDSDKKNNKKKNDKKIGKNNKTGREEIRNINSMNGGTAKSYRQKVLVNQAGKLVDELERARREEQESQIDGIIRQKVIKRKNTRAAYRIVGIVFILIGIACMWWAMGGHYRFLKAAVSIAAMAYGFYIVRASFRSAAYDATYLFGQDRITILQKGGSKIIPYEAVTGYTMIEPDPEMKYYILKFDRGTESYVVPFAGAKAKCEAVYNIFREKVRTDEKENS